jgi:hypothetical protein
VTMSLKASEGEAPMWWSVQVRYGTKWKFFVHPAGRSEVTVPADAKLGAISNVVVGAVDRCGNESERVLVGLGNAPQIRG